MLVAITGGSGFIGRNLYKRLSKNDSIKIKIFDISPPKFKLRDCDIFIQGDIMEKKDCTNLLKGVDIVFHNVSENRDVNIPNFYYYDLNEKGTQNLVEACREKNVKKIILKSTDKVYRKSADDNTKPKPSTFFGKSKLAAEKAIEKWAETDGNKALILRTCAVIGAGNRANMFNLIRVIDQGRKPFYLTTDRHIKSLTALNEFIDIAEHSINSELNFIEKRVFTCNVSSTPHLTVKQMHDIICEELGMKKPKFTIPHIFIVIAAILAEYLSFATRRPTAINYERASRLGENTEIKAEKIKEIGYKTDSSTDESLREMVRWYKSLKS